MRTFNEDFTVNADNDGIRNKNFSYNSSITTTTTTNNNNNSNNLSNGYGYHSQNSNSSAIPYHARENSLPFSYGQIGKTSTPLKSVVNNSASANSYRSVYGNNHNDNDSAYFSGGGVVGSGNGINNANYAVGGGGGIGGGVGYRDISDNYRKESNEVITDASMIKTQQRLKSPLLVRKTMNSHSPTRIGSNTISNTHYFNSNGSNGNYGGTGRLSPTINGNNGGLHSNFYGTTSRQRTPTRNDFEEMLRERREKVYNEYRETSTRPIDAVVPPPRQFRGEDTTDAVYAVPRHRKYDYDFEFHLKLDDDWLQTPQTIEKIPPQTPVRRSSSNAMEQYNNSNTFGKREQLQREQYRTRDIELPPIAPRDLERNYHTMSSTSTYTTNASQLGNRERERPLPPSTSTSQWSNGNNNGYGRDMTTERYFETYEQRRQQTQSLPQPQRQQLQPQSIQQQQRTEYTTTATYGNGNAASYGYHENSNNHNYHKSFNQHNISNNNNNNNNDVTETTVIYRSPLNATPTAAPIYATTTKQVAKSAAYRNEPTFSVTDYPSPRSMASPGTPLFSRPETPAFPVTPRTPFGTMQNGYSPNARRLDQSLSNGGQQYSSETIYQLTSPRSRLNSSFSVATTNGEPQEVAPHLVKFAKDSSKFWYKPNLSRDDAISLLVNAPPGTFVVRDSTTYKNAFGLVLRVAQPPPNTNVTGKPDELVRHFLIEPTTRGVRLKGCTNEPVFTSLSALVYEHSINQLALPCLLRIPEEDLVPPLVEPTPAQKQLLTQGAACNVLWLYSCDTESLTGAEAIRKAIRQMYGQKPLPTPTEVHFKVTQQGITLTDNTRKKFFRKHYASDMISFCAIDPDHRMWNMDEMPGGLENNKHLNVGSAKKTIFAFVARRSPSSKDNQCHVFCDLATTQPASAIISFANKTLPTERQRNYLL